MEVKKKILHACVEAIIHKGQPLSVKILLLELRWFDSAGLLVNLCTTGFEPGDENSS